MSPFGRTTPYEGSIRPVFVRSLIFPFRSGSAALRSTATSFTLAPTIERHRIPPRPRRLRARGDAFAVSFPSHPARPAHRILVYANPRQSSCIFSPFVHRVLSSPPDCLEANRAVGRRWSRWSLFKSLLTLFTVSSCTFSASRHPGLVFFFLPPNSPLDLHPFSYFQG
jgi:hypothetical protein